MPFHPSSLLFFLSLAFSVFFAVSASSWFVAWLALEINLLSFLPLIYQSNNKYSVESALKYFLLQALGSTLIISSAALSHQLLSFLVSFALLLKMGAAPFHQWMPAVSEGLSWAGVTALLTLQKLNPLILLAALSSATFTSTTLYFYVTASALVGAIGGLNQASLRKVLVFSSITHLSWLLSALSLSNWLWSSYFSLYSMILFSVVYILSRNQVSSISQFFSKMNAKLMVLLAISFMSLGGLPPFTGFLPKLMVVQELLNSGSTLILVPLLTGTFISLFFYARFFMSCMLMVSLNYKSVNLTLSEVAVLALNSTGLMVAPFTLLLK